MYEALSYEALSYCIYTWMSTTGYDVVHPFLIVSNQRMLTYADVCYVTYADVDVDDRL